MDLSNLRSRIESIKSKSAEPEKNHGSTSPGPDAASVLLENGWSRLAGMVFEKRTVLKNILPEAISDVLVAREAEVTAFPRVPGEYNPENFIFYDTETTGLSAGAGNIVFLAGFGRLNGTGDFEITQIFLSDFPGEPDFLQRLTDFIDDEGIYVSYNGRAFDSNVLKSRFAMNGISVEFGYQLDLLYPSRRLWKNIIGSCSLSDIESKVLDKRRTLDVPGFMVPDLYFDFIRSGNWNLIEGVISHHLEDIASLAELLALQEQLFSEAETPPAVSPEACTVNEFADPLGLAGLLLEKRPAAAEAVLKTAYKNGNNGAGAMLGLQLKKQERWNEAALLWEQIWNDSKSIFAGIELAKHYEHRLRDHEAALEITMNILGLERFRIRSHIHELDRRRKRLEAKTGKQKKGG